MDTEKNLILPTISEFSDEYYDAFYDEFADINIDNSEETETINDSETSNTVYVYDTYDYSPQLETINQTSCGIATLLFAILLFEIGKVVFNTLKEFF